jgi:hypothetical protein
MRTLVTGRSSEDSLGKRPTTRVRCLICELSVSAHIEGAQALAARFPETEGGESFGDVLLGAVGELGGALFLGFDELGDRGFSIEHAADVRGDFWLEVAGGDVGFGVLLEVELAALLGAGI